MKRWKSLMALMLALCLVLSGCSGLSGGKASQMDEINGALEVGQDADDYRTTYEVFVYSFYDSDGDGIGDLRGVLEKLDYINDGAAGEGEDLECSEIWLMPIFPSPTYHKYDTTDYTAVDPEYGTMDDFDALLEACHKRGIRLILDLAVNHTSSEHPWFLEASEYLKSLPEGQEPSVSDCPYFEYYNFSRDAQSGYTPIGDSGWYYESRFWSGMPDLNLDSQTVRDEIVSVMEFWLGKGVDGFRLDAVTSYYTGYHERNVAFLSWLKTEAERINPAVYLVAECWEDQSVYAEYYRSGLDSFFDFRFAGQDGLITNVVRGARSASSFGDALQAEEELYASYHGGYVNAPFYTNHDMARSAGYYASDDGSKTKLAMGLNLMMTGNAFIYYGEEIGMKGSGDDENKRAPMYWITEEEAKTDDQKALLEGVCDGPPNMGKVVMKYPTLTAQMEDPYSIYCYVRHAIRLRNAYPVIARGRTSVLGGLSGENICAMIRMDGNDSVLIVINTSDEVQKVDLSKDAMATPYTELGGVLIVNQNEVKLDGTTLTLPEYSIAVLTIPTGE